MIITYLDGDSDCDLDNPELFTNNIKCTSDFTYYNDFSVIDVSNNTYFLMNYSDIKLEDQNMLSLKKLINIPDLQFDDSSIKVKGDNAIIYPMYLTNMTTSYSVSTFLKNNSCTLNFNNSKIGLFNNNTDLSILGYMTGKLLNEHFTFTPLNLFTTYSLIPVNSKYYKLELNNKNPIRFNL